ncbi:MULTISPECIES: hypothetical protein [Sutcliffiella]|nr:MULTISPECIES: hypothetical protein [Sutcliffiella]WBL16017.1 hypothetical protein O1A01_05120 [Sutcliffiella sp. NC1]
MLSLFRKATKKEKKCCSVEIKEVKTETKDDKNLSKLAVKGSE